MRYVPGGVVLEVETVKLEVHVGVQEAGEKDPEAPAGKPAAAKEISTGVPDTCVSVKEKFDV